MTIGLIVLTFFLSLACVWIFRKLSAGNSRLLDIPNERSSHTAPVTRGAGVAIVLPVLLTYIVVFGSEANPAYVLAALAIAIVSFLDDLFTVPLLIRLAVHFIAAGLFVHFSGSYAEISVIWPGSTIQFGTSAPWITIFFIVWTINAFNFMDGIDGIAGAQGIGAALGWMLVGFSVGIQAYSTLGGILLGACAGFLVFNWQPAKVFMGDVGSTFLGFTFAVFPLIDSTKASEIGRTPLTITIIFLWLFLFDTAFTRFWQIVKLMPFWKPHREHLYQRIVHGGESHQNVAIFFGLIAIASAVAIAIERTVGWLPLTLLLIFSPIGLMVWAWKKRLT